MKIVIVLDHALERGYLANAAACIASGLFHDEENLLGPSIDGDGFTYLPITQIPILIVTRKTQGWNELLVRARKNHLKFVVFTQDAQSTTSYSEYTDRVRGKPLEEVTVLGIGVLGEERKVQKFCGDLPLLR